MVAGHGSVLLPALLLAAALAGCAVKTTGNSGLAAGSAEGKAADLAEGNLEIVKSTYEGKTSEENGRNLERHLAPEATWTEAAGFPYGGTYTGFREIAEKVFARLAGEWEGYRFEPQDYVASGDKVVAYGTYKGTYKRTGKYFEARVAHLWTLKAGKIIRFEQFVDSRTVATTLE